MQPNDLILLVFVAGLFALMWNNGRKRKKAALELQNNLVAGTEVMLSSGIFATVVSVADDKITVSSGTSTLVVAKGAILRVIPTELKTETPKSAAPKAVAKKPATKATKTAK